MGGARLAILMTAMAVMGSSATSLAQQSRDPGLEPPRQSLSSQPPPGTAQRQPAQRLGRDDEPDRREQPEPGDPGPVELNPSVEMAEAAGWIFRPDPEPSDRGQLAEENLERYFDERLQTDRLDAIGAHPWYHTMMREMRRSFRPDMEQLEDSRRAAMNPVGRVFDELGRYAEGPEPPQDPPGTPPPEIANSHLGQLEQAGLEMAEWQNLNNAPVTWYRVKVRVTQNPEGVVSAAWVEQSSGYPSLDRQAVRAVTDGATRLPPPPPEVTGDRQAIQTDWSFEAGDVATQYGQTGCVDDPVNGGYQCAGPFGRGIVRTRIRLLRVVDGEHGTFEERRHERLSQPPVLDGD